MSKDEERKRFWNPTSSWKPMRRFDGTGPACSAGRHKKDRCGEKTIFGLQLWRGVRGSRFCPGTGRHSRVCRVWVGRITPRGKAEPETGIEPVTHGLRNRCSTAELLRRSRIINQKGAESQPILLEAPRCGIAFQFRIRWRASGESCLFCRIKLRAAGASSFSHCLKTVLKAASRGPG